MTAKKVAAKKEEKKEEGFLLLMVFKTTHGSLFSKHSHYSNHLIQVKGEDDARANAKAARKAAEIMGRDRGIETELIIAEKVKATNTDEMRAAVQAKMGNLGNVLSEIIKSL